MCNVVSDPDVVRLIILSDLKRFVFHSKYMKLFDARPNAIFCVSTLVYQTTEDCVGSGASEERSHRCICLSAGIHGNTSITFLFIQMVHGGGGGIL